MILPCYIVLDTNNCVIEMIVRVFATLLCRHIVIMLSTRTFHRRRNGNQYKARYS